MRCFTLLLALIALSGSHAKAAPCDEPPNLRLWTSPAEPFTGVPLRIFAVGENPILGDLVVSSGRSSQTLASKRNGSAPYSLFAEKDRPASGTLRIELRHDGQILACKTVTVAPRPPRRTPPEGEGAWKNTRAWDRATENLFSAWIERLFDAEVDAAFSFPSLAPVIRDPSRNFLYGHWGLGEDDPKNRNAAKATPDCADLPYYLRAYFAWKLGLPMAMRDCDRGKSDRPPRCGTLLHNEEPLPGPAKPDRLARFRAFLSLLANRVHSGSARTALADEETDFYPVALTHKDLRPGTIYADPYGHVLMVTEWVPQTSDRGGLLFAVDGQPDNSVGRKRFWEGTFLFANDTPSAGPGFKAFRPVLQGKDNLVTPLTNRALGSDGRFATFSDEQGRLKREAFYARMAKLVNPKGLSATTAYQETLSALLEQLTTRLGSVENGEKYMRDEKYPIVPMPEGPKIFETVGPWEDYATPSRDMRLLIALRVLSDLPARIEAHPDLFLLQGQKPAQVRKAIETLHAQQITQHGIEYQRSDGSRFRLTVADMLARRSALGMAYNPNDCVEVRWGATPGTPDYATCQRHAPKDQLDRMKSYLPWFLETRRPPR